MELRASEMKTRGWNNHYTSIILLLYSSWISKFLCISLVEGLACTPPRGWNSYDSFSWIVSEQEFLQNAEYVAKNLKPFGYEYVVVDFLWYRRHVPGASVWSAGFDLTDEWGRPIPDPARWPSTAGGKGFGPIADKVHAMGLKFGLHVMRGISTAAIAKNTPIFGAQGSPDGSKGVLWRAQDIALPNRPCYWMSCCFVSVNTTSEGGKAFIKSLYQQYASWKVDFIKHDCVFGAEDMSLDEIESVSQAIVDTGRPMVYSLSPGVRATPEMGLIVHNLSHMYRVTSDDWDTWPDVHSHFDVARDFASAGLIGASGLQGGLSWPDLDMLPLGWLTDPGAPYGPYRKCRLSYEEQKSQITLWAMAKSPLMYGGDLRNIDNATLGLITNPVVLHINAHSFGNHEVFAGPAPGNASPPILRVVRCNETIRTKWVINQANSGMKNECLCWFGSNLSINGEKRSSESSGCLDRPPSMNTCSEFLDDRGNTGDGVQYLHIDQARTSAKEFGKSCMDSWKRWPTTFRPPKSHGILPVRSLGETWQVTPEGQLMNSRHGLCASVHQEVNITRIWTAKGPSGELYVAFFNLGLNQSSISVPVDRLMKGSVLHSSSEEYGALFLKPGIQCVALDVWSNKNFGISNGLLSALVPPHGTVLFSVTCSDLSIDSW